MRGDSVAQAGEVRSARIESLRALAALSVLLAHSYVAAHPNTALTSYHQRVLAGGGTGVFVFFALSGYLLFLPFARRDLTEGRRIDLGQYARNRALRILPLYYAVVIVLLLFQEHGGTVRDWLLFGTFSENFSVSSLNDVNPVFWSLVVELQFYLLLPLLALLIARVARGSVGRAAAVAVGLGAASFLLHFVTDDLVLAHSLPYTFMFFTAGMLLVLLRFQWEGRPPSWLRGPLGMSGAWIAAAAGVYLVVVAEVGEDWLPAVLAFLLVGGCVLPLRPGRLVGVLGWKPLAAVGVASYSLYLWHPPLLRVIDDLHSLQGSTVKLLAVAVPACLAAAFLSYALVEAPFLRLRRRWGTTAAVHVPDAGSPPASTDVGSAASGAPTA